MATGLWLGLADPELGVEELRRVRDFGAAHPSEALAERPDVQFAAAISSSLSFRVQTAERPGPGISELVAQAAAFDRRAGLVHELGAVLVAPSHRGLGLQRRLMEVAIVHLAEQSGSLLDEPDWLVLAAVARSNEASRASIVRVGLEEASDADAAWSEIGRDPSDFRKSGKMLFVLREPALVRVRSSLAAFAPKPVVATKPDGPPIEVGFDRRLARYGRPEYYATYGIAAPDEDGDA